MGALKAMGFRSYADYLHSDLWREIRARVLERDPTCQVCERARATEVHHRAYDRATMDGRTLEQLVAICRPCHDDVERIKARVKKAARRARARKKDGRIKGHGTTKRRPWGTRPPGYASKAPCWAQAWHQKAPKRRWAGALSQDLTPRLVKPE